MLLILHINHVVIFLLLHTFKYDLEKVLTFTYFIHHVFNCFYIIIWLCSHYWMQRINSFHAFYFTHKSCGDLLTVTYFQILPWKVLTFTCFIHHMFNCFYIIIWLCSHYWMQRIHSFHAFYLTHKSCGDLLTVTKFQIWPWKNLDIYIVFITQGKIAKNPLIKHPMTNSLSPTYTLSLLSMCNCLQSSVKYVVCVRNVMGSLKPVHVLQLD